MQSEEFKDAVRALLKEIKECLEECGHRDHHDDNYGHVLNLVEWGEVANHLWTNNKSDS